MQYYLKQWRGFEQVILKDSIKSVSVTFFSGRLAFVVVVVAVVVGGGGIVIVSSNS